MVIRKNKGIIIPNGVSLEKHENETVVFLTELGYDIELIKPSAIPNMKMPDFMMRGIAWEMKSPQGSSKRTLEHIFRRASKQSENIVVDLRRTNFSTDGAIKELERRYKKSKRVKKMLVVTREKKLLDFC